MIDNILNTFAGIPIITMPKNIKVKRTWRQRLHMRLFWPFGSVKWEYKSILGDDELVILNGFVGQKILISEVGLDILKGDN